MSDFDLFSEVMNNMGGDDNGDLPEVDRANGDSQDSNGQKNARSGVRNIVISWIYRKKNKFSARLPN
jgi:hypothetical protein